AGIADLETGKAADGDVFAQLADHTGNELADGDSLVLDKGLIEQADLFVKLRHLAFDNLLNHIGRFAGGRSLGAVDFFFALEISCGHIFPANELRIAGGNVHGNIVHQLLELFGAGNEVTLAVDLKQHPDLAASMNVAGDRAFASHASRLLGRRSNALFA